MKCFEFDSAGAPLVVCTFHATPTAEDCGQIATAYRELFARKRRLCFISDVRAMSLPSARDRQAIARLLETIDADLETYSAGAVVVLRSGLLRGAMTAIRWIAKPVTPEIFVGTLAEAADEAEALMRGANLDINLQARARLAQLRAVHSDRVA